MRRLIVIVFVAFAMLAAGGTSVGAAGVGKPVAVEKFDRVFDSELDEFLTYVCGVEIWVGGHEKGTDNFYEDGSVRVHYNSTFEFHSPETGETMIRRDAANARVVGAETVDPETGWTTATFDELFVGLPAQWSKKGEGVLLRDAGQARFQGTVVFDDEGNFVSFEETITTKGPHPELETDVLHFICDAMGGSAH